MCTLPDLLTRCLLALNLWAAPQPVYSEGLLVVYGSERLIAANAEYHGYTLEGYAGGASAISPSMLGRILWIRTEHSDWIGPLLVVDGVAQGDAADSIWGRHEVAEIDRADGQTLGFEYGSWGYAFFGACPPDRDSLAYQPQPYAPDPEHVADYTGRRSFAPYPEQQRPVDC